MPLGAVVSYVMRLRRHAPRWARSSLSTEACSSGPWINDMDARRARHVDVALEVDFHPVGHAWLIANQLIEDPSVAHASVRVDVEDSDVGQPGVVDVQQQLIRREA